MVSLPNCLQSSESILTAFEVLSNSIFESSNPHAFIVSIASLRITEICGSFTSLFLELTMIISAYGLVLLFASNQAIVLVTAPYPPFGLATISFMGLSAYLVVAGIYSSAVSVSLDVGLRKTIRKSVIEQSKLLY